MTLEKMVDTAHQLKLLVKMKLLFQELERIKLIRILLNLWIVSDNLLRGAALNSVEIAETLIKYNLHGK